MNSGWRYQYIAKDCAVRSRRFVTVSDIGASEADFNATMNIVDSGQDAQHLCLDQEPREHDGRSGLAEGDLRARKRGALRQEPLRAVHLRLRHRDRQGSAADPPIGKTKAPHSVNTEVWLSDFFWPFFANYTYAEIAKAVFEVLMETGKQAQHIMASDASVTQCETRRLPWGSSTETRVHRCAVPGEGQGSSPLDETRQIFSYAGASAMLQRNGSRVISIRCMMTANLRAIATRAFLPPCRTAIRTPHAFRGDNLLTRVRMEFAAS